MALPCKDNIWNREYETTAAFKYVILYFKLIVHTGKGTINSTAWLRSNFFILGHPLVEIAKKKNRRFAPVVEIAKKNNGRLALVVEIAKKIFWRFALVVEICWARNTARSKFAILGATKKDVVSKFLKKIGS